jgi:hypothetical protein
MIVMLERALFLYIFVIKWLILLLFVVKLGFVHWSWTMSYFWCLFWL